LAFKWCTSYLFSAFLHQGLLPKPQWLALRHPSHVAFVKGADSFRGEGSQLVLAIFLLFLVEPSPA
jgi:hypothetical protein